MNHNKSIKHKTIVILTKLLRWLRITKPIQLNDNEIKWILICKHHLKDKYPSKSNWIETLKKPFEEIYGWNQDDDNNYNGYLECVFIRLFDIYTKIQLDQSGNNIHIKHILVSSFYKGISIDNELPIERAICALCGEISNTLYLLNGVPGYNLK